MKRLLLIILLLSSTFLQAQIVEWASDYVDGGVSDITTDKYGDVYTVGSFYKYLKYRGTIDTSHVRKRYNFFLAKTDNQGNLLWRSDGGKHNHGINAIKVLCTDNGSIYVAGHFTDSIFLEDTAFVSNKIWRPGGSMFIAKYSSSGRFRKVIEYDSIPFNYTKFRDLSLSEDLNGNIVFGNGMRVVTYDNNLNLIKQQVLPTSPIGPPHSSYVVTKNGVFYHLWNVEDSLLKKRDMNLKMIWGIKNDHLSHSIDPNSTMDIDSNGNIYMLGYYKDSLQIGSHKIVARNSDDHQFVCKINDAGQIQWLESISSGTVISVFDPGNNIRFVSDSLLVVHSNHRDTFNFKGIFESNVEYFTLGINATNGNYKWHLSSSGNKEHYPNYLSSFSDNIIYSCGWSDSLKVQNRQLGSDGYVMKIIEGSNLISGKVFVDNNSNGTKDVSEEYKDQIVTNIAPYNTAVSTVNGGKYQYYVPIGNYSVNIPNPPKYYSVVPTNHSINITSNGTQDTNNHFALQPDGIINDLSIDITSFTPVRPGFSAAYNLTYRNVGTTTLNGHVRLDYDGKLSYNSASASPDSTATSALSWNFNNLEPFEVKSINLYFTVDSTATLGDTVCNIARIYPIINDTTPINNRDTLKQIIVGSFDPNDKTALPEGAINTSKLLNGEEIEYLIRFQNTGTDTAFTVRVRDTISSLLDIGSLEMIAASHDYQMSISEGNAIEWLFRDILLVDSNRNEPLSHGFIRYKIKASQDVSHGDLIKNTAYIYFDFNEPVVTNTTESEVSDWAGISDPSPTQQLMIIPNPSNGTFEIRGIESGSKILIHDVSGKDVISLFNITQSDGQVRIHQKTKQAGLYIVTSTKDGSTLSGKVVITN